MSERKWSAGARSLANRGKTNLRDPWQPGESGNPSGRPKGLRPRVNEAFLRDMLDGWEKHGKKAIERMIETDPTGFVQVMAALMDKHMTVTAELDVIRAMSDEEIYARLAELRSIDTRIPALPGTTKTAQSTTDPPHPVVVAEPKKKHC